MGIPRRTAGPSWTSPKRRPPLSSASHEEARCSVGSAATKWSPCPSSLRPAEPSSMRWCPRRGGHGRAAVPLRAPKVRPATVGGRTPRGGGEVRHCGAAVPRSVSSFQSLRRSVSGGGVWKAEGCGCGLGGRRSRARPTLRALAHQPPCGLSVPACGGHVQGAVDGLRSISPVPRFRAPKGVDSRTCGRAPSALGESGLRSSRTTLAGGAEGCEHAHEHWQNGVVRVVHQWCSA